MPELTRDETKILDDIIVNGEDHGGFLHGGDVLEIARMMRRMFVPSEIEDSKGESDSYDPKSKPASRKKLRGAKPATDDVPDVKGPPSGVTKPDQLPPPPPKRQSGQGKNQAADDLGSLV